MAAYGHNNKEFKFNTVSQSINYIYLLFSFANSPLQIVYGTPSPYTASIFFWSCILFQNLILNLNSTKNVLIGQYTISIKVIYFLFNYHDVTINACNFSYKYR